MTIALWGVLGAAFLPYLCIVIARFGLKGFDNHHPRQVTERFTGWRARAISAERNSWEAFALFAAGVFAAHLAQAPQSRMDMLALAFIAVRLVYITLYVGDKPSLRSSVWLVGFLLTIALFVIGA